MKEIFQYIVNEYQEAYGQNFAKHDLGNVLRQILPDTINGIIDANRYLVQGSSGRGVWAACPWVAIFDVLVTKSAQSGYYPVFLFKDDMSGFYLSLNQGVTSIENVYKSDAKHVLSIKAQDYRAQIGDYNAIFVETKITLKTKKTTKSKYPLLYEAGNIVAKYYSASQIPSTEQLREDIREILKIYKQIVYNDSISANRIEIENDEENYIGFEDLRKFRFHKRIERNIQLSKKVKKIQGYNCAVCEINFETTYGLIGKNFIEAHHLKPLSSLIEERVPLDARTDFVVLCSNCHSMIHRYHDASDIEGFKNLINSK